ncbi:MBL fold metallo-hydrolase [Ancylobacter amanitiformis]|uniref:Metallo-beta-lactamase domain-containing protein n=1 Tax=Ancylobacter amanitiformis TaxID=217069 RepID=A0ABU0LR77_9HYPH|nr:MBL fold metallo-hydrolase [Ancylobacter amanitiformis]MDQ0511190.1 hypothetical protein [Ancylobacter amanitiformis]
MNRLTALSGAGVKGPACFLLETAGRRLLLDLGEGPDAGRRPNLAGVGRVDAILLSHGHHDHVGALDLAGQLGDPPLYATAAVRALAGEARLRNARDLPLEGTAGILGLEIATGPAGHAPGAVWMRIGGEAGLLYTGDYSAESRLYRCTLPLRAAALVVDASYGEVDQTLALQAAALIARARHRPLLLPAPAAGRALEMALTFLDAGLAVSLCPVTRGVVEVLARHPEVLAAGAADAPARLLASTPLTADSPARGAMIVAGPQADHGLSAALTARFARSGEADIVFTGHVAEGSNAGRRIAAAQAHHVRWNVHPSFGALQDLVTAVAPRVLLPAFLPRARMAGLAARLPGLSVVTEGDGFCW